MIIKKSFDRGIILTADDVGLNGVEGELKVGATAKKLQVYLDGAVRSVVTENQSQTLTNKTIDADSNTISNLEVDNLKSGVLNTDLSVPTPTDLEIPSALAAKTYADSAAASGAAGVQANLDAHINDTADAHDASAISSVPAGNLAATNVQAALEELQLDIDTRATTTALNAHINDTADAHDASAISVIPFGNQSETNLQDAVDELQTEIDGRVAGPASATDEALARFDGTTGKLVQNSVAVLTDAGALSGLSSVTTSNLLAVDQVREGTLADSTTTGANQTITPSSPIIVFSNSGLTSIAGIDTPNSGRNITLINRTGNAITIGNESGSATAANRILTGTKAALTLADQASILLKYDSGASRWNIIGGSGAGTGASLDTIFQLTGTDLSTWSTGNNAAFLGGGSIAGTFVADTTTPLQGIASYVYTQPPVPAGLNDYMASAAQPVDIRFRGQNCTLYFPYTYDGANNDIQVVFYDVTNSAVIPSSAFIQASTSVAIFRTNIVIPLTCASIRVGFQSKVNAANKIFEFDSVQLTSDTTIMADIAQGNVGEILTSAGSVAPANFLACDGAAVSRTAYAALFAAIGITHGQGDGSTTFNLPDYRGRFLRGRANGSANDPGRASRTAMNTGGNTGDNVGSVQGDTFQGHAMLLPLRTSDGGAAPPVQAGFAASGGNNAAVTGVTMLPTNDGTNGVPRTSSETRPVNAYVNYYIRFATSAPNGILTAPDTFSTDTAPLVYAPSSTYTLATLANAPVGTFITFTYAANTNTRTQTTAAPIAQTYADMNVNGILIYTRAYNVASNSNFPSTYAIQIGKGMKGVSLGIYKSAGKAIDGTLDFAVHSANAGSYGIAIKSYNEVTGILFLDAGFNSLSQTSVNLVFSDLTGASSGFLTINASKNPALTGLNISAVAARGVNSSGSSFGAAGATLTFDATKTYDTHGALNAATGVFTAPEAGYYSVSSTVCFNNAAYAVAAEAYMEIVVNGLGYSTATSVNSAAYTGFKTTSIRDTVFLAKGSTLSITLYNSRGSTALRSIAALNYISIIKTSVG